MDQNLKVMSKQERLENWAARITACRLFQALSEQQQAAQQPAFVEITSTPNVRPSGGAAVTVRIAGAEADIYSGADAVTVETVLRILKSC